MAISTPLIDRLMAQQLERLTACVEDWTRVGLSVEPADRPSAQTSVAQAYAQAGRRPPTSIIWLDSPQAGVMAATVLNETEVFGAQLGRQLGHEVQTHAEAVVGDQLGKAVRDEVALALLDLAALLEGGFGLSMMKDPVWPDALGSQVLERLSTQTGHSVTSDAWKAAEARLATNLISKHRAQVHQAIGGQHDAASLGMYALFAELCGHGPEFPLQPQFELARSCGWWWPFEDIVILTERPVDLIVGTDLAPGKGWRLRYRDGFELTA